MAAGRNIGLRIGVHAAVVGHTRLRRTVVVVAGLDDGVVDGRVTMIMGKGFVCI